MPASGAASKADSRPAMPDWTPRACSLHAPVMGECCCGWYPSGLSRGVAWCDRMSGHKRLRLQSAWRDLAFANGRGSTRARCAPRTHCSEKRCLHGRGVMAAAMSGISVLPVVGLGEIVPGTDLAVSIASALRPSGRCLVDGDILEVTPKIGPKAEGCLVDLATVSPSRLPLEWARRWDKDARVVELVLRHSRRIVRMDRGVIISETFH